ncbi:fibrobacter succinogenes major paralogous domain-containing protein, partial [Flavobacteriales bacterium]|nr:fibrobacter succinogenes major paralogous domain-containing protein [Flavobacteriales bacterium]
LDNLMVWSSPLAFNQASSLDPCQFNPTSPDLLGFWPFNGSDASVALDASGNNQHGMLDASRTMQPAQTACSPCFAESTVMVQLLISNCTDSLACNYNAMAILDDGSCDYSCCPGPGCCADGTVWDIELEQCVGQSSPCDTVFLPIPSCGPGTVWDPVAEECIIAIPADLNYDGCVTVNDLLELLAVHGTCPPYPEWPDEPTGTTWACGDPVTHWGYNYATVLIGGQCWFAENCRHMPTISAPTNLGTSNPDTLPRAFVYGYPGDIISEAESTEEYATYGNMYNWIALEEWEVCPNGWHVPTDSDWQSLESNTGMSTVEVTGIGWMRGHEDGLSMELQNNGFQINSKGGFVHHTLGFLDGDEQAFYWSSTLDNANPSTPGPIFHRRFSEIQEGIYRGSDFNQNSGAYVRCLRD